MMALLRRLLKHGSDLSPEMQRKAERTDKTLQHERGELRQVVQNINAGQRLMYTWEDANRMVREARND
jgi:CHASE3 domain sensor protein